MRFRFTLFLLFLNILVLGSIFYLGQRAAKEGSGSSGLSSQIGRELIDADRIELRGRGLEQPRILKRNGSSWKLVEPMEWTANFFAINRILNQLQFIEEDASFSISEIEKNGQSLADYGLEEPILELSIGDGREIVTLSIGMLTEIGNNVYLLGPNRREIFVVDREVIDGLLLDLNDIRTREIFAIPVFEVDALSLQIRSEVSANDSFLKVRLARNNGQWAFEAPVAADADPTLVDNTINTLTAAKVRRFIEEPGVDLADYGLDEPFMQVTINGNQRSQTLLVGDQVSEEGGATEYFAKLESNPSIFTVSAGPFDALREAQEALRERNFMRFEKALLSTITIEERGREIRLQKLEAGGWQVLESNEEAEIQPRRADPEMIEVLLSTLSSLRASDFAMDTPSTSDDERLGFNEPRRLVTLNFSQGDPLVLRLAHPEDENFLLYAKTNRADFIYAVERRETLEQLPLNALHYRDRSLHTLPEAARIKRIELMNMVDGTMLIEAELTEADAEWDRLLSAMEPKRAASLRGLLSTLRNFTVKRYLLDRFAEAYPVDEDRVLPWTYKLSAQIELPGGEEDRIEELTYYFTERLSGSIQVGGSEERSSIFEISQTLIDSLEPLTDPLEFPAEAEELPVSSPPSTAPVETPAPVDELTEE